MATILKNGLEGEFLCSDDARIGINKNFTKLDLKMGSIEMKAALTAAPVEGETLILNSDKKVYIYKGGVWQSFTPSKGLTIPNSTNLEEVHVFDGTVWVLKSFSGSAIGSAVNVGTGEQVFKQVGATDLEFRTLKAGSGISVGTIGDEVFISKNAPFSIGGMASEALADAAALGLKGSALSAADAGNYSYFDTVSTSLKVWNGSSWSEYGNDIIAFSDLASFPAIGEPTTIYLALDDKKIYMWIGGVYSEVSVSEGGDAASTFTVLGAAPAALGSLVYNDGSGWGSSDHTDADKVATHMIVEVNGATSYKLQASGVVELTGHGFTVGDFYFGSLTVLGGVQITKPVIPGDLVKSTFLVLDANNLELLLVNEPYILEAAEVAVPLKRAYKYLPSDISLNSTNIAALEHTGLTIGKNYKVFLQVSFVVGNASAMVRIVHSGADIANIMGGTPIESSSDRFKGSITVEFNATSTNVVFGFNEFSVATLQGNGTKSETYSYIQETDYTVVEVASL